VSQRDRDSLQERLSAAEAQLKRLHGQPAPAPFLQELDPEPQAPAPLPVVEVPSEDLLRAQEMVDTLSHRYQPTHPEMKRAIAQRDAIQTRITVERERQKAAALQIPPVIRRRPAPIVNHKAEVRAQEISNLESEIEGLRAQVATLDGSISHSRNEAEL